MSLQRLMSQSIMKVQRQTSTKDAAGGFANAWTDLYSGVACRIEDASASTIEKFARMQQEVTHEIFTTQAGITNGMRIISGGRTFIVQQATREYATGRMPAYSVVFALETKSRA